MLQYKIFIIDDDQSILKSVCLAFQKDYNIEGFPDAKSGLAAMDKEIPDLVLLDIGLPDINGLEMLKIINKKYPDCIVTMVTAFEDIQTIVSALKGGAEDYILKPLHMETLEHSIRQSLKTIRLRSEIRALQQQYVSEKMPVLIGESHAVQDMVKTVKQIAKSPNISVLITGDTGTGKEIVAKMIHYHSPKFNQSFVTLNCAAIPQDLLESELFGYAPGAFSGANSSGKKGLIESADHGTLFLDEIVELSMASQAKLLRFMENGTFYQLGSTIEKKVSVRVISATNHSVEKLMETGAFREDLYYRLQGVRIGVPKLSERVQDIPLLAKYFAGNAAKKMEKEIWDISAEAINELTGYPWPGNVRELKNTMERAVLMAQSQIIQKEDIGISTGNNQKVGQFFKANFLPPLSPEGINFTSLQKHIESFYFTEAMELCNGNESHAARLLGLKHHIFRYNWKKINESSSRHDTQ